MKNKQYIVTINYESEPIEAKDEDDAINKLLIEIDGMIQETLETFIIDQTTAKEIKE